MLGGLVFALAVVVVASSSARGVEKPSAPAARAQALSTAADASTPSGAIEPGFDSGSYGGNDDGSFPCVGAEDGTPFPCAPTAVSLPFAIDFFGTTYTGLYLNNNGNLTFDGPLGTYTPYPLSETGPPMIAPFFADVDTRAGPTVTFGSGNVNGHSAWGVTWPGVGCYREITSVANTFQVLLIDRSDVAPGDFDVEFNYGNIQWDSGEASGGDANCVGGTAARAGYASGSAETGSYFELPGSGENDALLDSNDTTGLVHGSHGSSQPGRYVYQFRDGLPLTTSGAPATGVGQGNGDTTVHDPVCNHGAPVNCASGEFWHRFTDAVVPGRGPALDLARTYNSMSAGVSGLFGYGWASTYGMNLASNPDGTVTITAGDGSQVTATPAGGGSFGLPAWADSTLTQNGDGTWTFVRHQTETFTFSATGQLLAIADPNGYRTTLAYDAGGRLASVTDPAGRKLLFAYGSDGLVSSVTDPLSRMTRYGYDGAGNLTSVTDSAGGVTRFAYDAGHRLVTMTDPNGGVSTNVYDGSGHVTSQTDPLGRLTTYAYSGENFSAFGGSTTITGPNGNVEVQHYVNGELVTDTRGAGSPAEATWAYEYDPDTLGVTSLTDPNGHVTTNTYDASGNLTSTTDPLGRTTTATFNALDEPLATTDPSGVTTTFVYDANGNLGSVSRPLGMSQTQTKSLAYGDAAHPGDVTGVTDANGKTTTLVHDANGDLLSTTDPLGNRRTATYDVAGELLTTVSARGNAAGANPAQFTTSYAYDALGRVIRVTDPLGHVTTKSYDGDGNPIAATDRDGNTTLYRYDADNELVGVTRADGTTVQYGYDGDGNQLTQTDGAGRTTSYAYDALDRLSSVTDPLGRTTAYGYDATGNRTSLVDPSGRTTSYAYDAANELTSVGYSDGTTPNVTYAYSADGQRTSMADGTGTTAYVYDTLNRLTSQTNGAGQTVAYGYDLAGHLTSLTYPNGKTVTRTYDAAGRLTAIRDWLGHTTTLTPNPDGATAGVAYGNGVTAATVFDATDRPTTITDKAAGGSTLASFAYARDGNGQVTSTTPTGAGQGGNETYSYTTLNQLKTLNGSTYGYDAADNIVKLANGTGLAYDAANEVTTLTPTSGPATTFAYDPEGNRKNGLAPGGSAVGYSYDQANRLVGSNGGASGHLFAYAAGTGCGAISISGSNNDISRGVLWSNGGITATGTHNSAAAVLVAKAPPTCSFPSSLTPPGPTPVAPRAAGDWPVPLPAVPATCTSGNAPALNASWLATHAPGVYCWTGTISISASGLTFNGYELVSNGATQANAIAVTGKDTFVGSILYATAGGVTVSGTTTLSGQIFAPKGTVALTSATNAMQSASVEGAGLAISGNSSSYAGSGPDVLPTTYTYDGDGLRASKTALGATLRFAWNLAGGPPVPLTDGSTSYLYDDSGTPLEQIDAAGTPLYYQHDQLGSTRLLTDQGGNVVATYSYDPYGNLTGHTGTADTPLRWAGQYQDANTGLYYLHARYYDPLTAQFLTRDPIAPVTQAPYAYVGGNPLTFVDVTGLDCGWNPFCYAGEVIDWVGGHPIQAIGITVATASLILTLGTDAPEVFAVDFALVETADGGTAFAIAIEDVVIPESELVSLLGSITEAYGYGEAAYDCLYERNYNACAWDITGLLIGRGLTAVGADELQRKVFDWLVEVGGPIVAPDPTEPPPGPLGPPCPT